MSGLAILCALLAALVALPTMVFASAAVDPEADSAAWGLGAGADVGLFATTALLSVSAAGLRRASLGAATLRQRRPLAYWLVVAGSFGLFAAQLGTSAAEGLQLELLFIPATLGLLVGLLAAMLGRAAPGFITAAGISAVLAAVSFRDGPYGETLGFWLPRLALLALALAGLALLAREVSARGAH